MRDWCQDCEHRLDDCICGDDVSVSNPGAVEDAAVARIDAADPLRRIERAADQMRRGLTDAELHVLTLRFDPGTRGRAKVDAEIERRKRERG